MKLLLILRRVTYCLRKIPGGVLIGDVIRKYFASLDRTIRIDDFDHDMVMHTDLGEHMQSQIFWYGSYSRDIIPVLKSTLKTADIVIDCGANVGEITLIAAKQVGPNGRVYSFEPIDTLANRLERHVSDNLFDNIEVIHEGVARERGVATMYSPVNRFGDGARNDGLASIFRTHSQSRPTQSVNLISLDEFAQERGLKRLDLIKIDIEGGELFALQGASELLRTFHPTLIVEVGAETSGAAGYEMSDLYRFIASFGYSMLRIGRRGNLEPVDIDDLREFQNLYCSKR